MYEAPAAPLPIGGVIDDAIRLYRSSFRSCWLISLIAAILLGAVSVMLLWRISQAGVAGTRNTPLAALAVYKAPDVWGFTLLSWIVRMAAYGAVVRRLFDIAEGAGVRPDAVSGMLTRLPLALLTYIMMCMAIGAGLLLLLVPGVWLTGALCLWPVALFADDRGALGSLKYSRELTRGHWWRTCTILTVILILMLVFGAVIGGIATALLLTATRDPLLVQMLLQIVVALANIFMLPVFPAALVAIYRDLKLRREGGDLAARLGALGSA